MLLALSVVAGIVIARNRLSALRVSARTARIRQLRDRWLDQGRTFEFDRLRKQSEFFSSWHEYIPGRSAENQQVRTASSEMRQALLISLPKATQEIRRGPDGTKAQQAITSLVEALRAWSDKADDRTWRMLTWQAVIFSAGAILLLLVGLTYPS